MGIFGFVIPYRPVRHVSRAGSWLAACAAALLCVVVGLPGRAGAAVVPLGNQQQRVAAYHEVLEKRAPGLIAPLVETYPAAADAACGAAGGKGRTFAILVGAGDIGAGAGMVLKGPDNDVELLEARLRDMGVAPDHIVTLVGTVASRAHVAAAFAAAQAEARCGDRVIVHFSARSVRAPELAAAVLQRAKDIVAPADFEKLFSESAIQLSQRVLAETRLTQADRTGPGAAAAARAAGVQLAFDDDLAILLDDDDPEFHEVVRGRDVSDFMVAVRNKGADVVASLDVLYAAAARIEVRQRLAGDASGWNYAYDGAPGDYWPQVRLGRDHGEFAVLYACGEDELSYEMPLPRDADNRKVYGLFSFTLASALLNRTAPTPRELADEIQAYYGTEKRDRGHPRIEASDPDLVIVAEVQPPRQDPIKILNPTPKRGAAAIQRAEIEIEGQVGWTAPVVGVLVGNEETPVDAEGRFKRMVRLSPGLNSVSIVAVTADSRMHKKTLELVYEGDLKALEGEGRRYAVLIANQAYGPDTGLPKLETPVADADAIAAVLTGRYGFTTELALPDGRKLPLVLKDAGRNDILFRLEDVARNVGPKDQVLIYYAGHGVYEQMTSLAFWVPADARVGYSSSFLSADDISSAIKRMQAGNVILISDSCYSGSLMRGGPEGRAEAISDADRNQALLRLQARRSRVLVTSGNNEPVADLGGGGHSVFARALLTGLESQPHDAFSARELFDGYILQQVTANADQEPQFRPLEKVGHEGGDFVFVRTAAAQKAAAD